MDSHASTSYKGIGLAAYLLDVLSELVVLKDLRDEDSVGIAEYDQGAPWHSCQSPHSLSQMHTHTAHSVLEHLHAHPCLQAGLQPHTTRVLQCTFGTN